MTYHTNNPKQNQTSQLTCKHTLCQIREIEVKYINIDNNYAKQKKKKQNKKTKQSTKTKSKQ